MPHLFEYSTWTSQDEDARRESVAYCGNTQECSGSGSDTMVHDVDESDCQDCKDYFAREQRAVLREQVVEALNRSDFGRLEEIASCVCCCDEHTFDECPARLWSGCRGSNTYSDGEPHGQGGS